MKQTRFEWAEQGTAATPTEVTLDPETIETVIVLMAHALIAIVRATEEATDER